MLSVEEEDRQVTGRRTTRPPVGTVVVACVVSIGSGACVAEGGASNELGRIVTGGDIARGCPGGGSHTGGGLDACGKLRAASTTIPSAIIRISSNVMSKSFAGVLVLRANSTCRRRYCSKV